MAMMRCLPALLARDSISGGYITRMAGSVRALASAVDGGAASGGGQATGTQASPAQPAQQQAPPTGPPKLIVFGGRGFLGSAVCREALRTGLHVVSISPSGTPPPTREPWTRDVEWLRGDALSPPSYSHALHGALGAVSCIGAFGDNATMQRINGTANAAAIAAAAAAGVPRFVYVSAALPPLPGLDALLPGYVQGKRQAEEELARCYPSSGIALRPWVIYGDRQVSAHITLPLGMAFGPVAALLRRIPNARQLAGVPVVGAGFLPPVPVERVAQLAVTAATDDSMPAGVMDAWAVAGW